MNELICEFVQVINEMQISRNVAHGNGTSSCCLDAVFLGDNNYPGRSEFPKTRRLKVGIEQF